MKARFFCLGVGIRNQLNPRQEAVSMSNKTRESNDSVSKLVSDALKRILMFPTDAVCLLVENDPELLHRYLDLLATVKPTHPDKGQSSHHRLHRRIAVCTRNTWKRLFSEGMVHEMMPLDQESGYVPVSRLLKSVSPVQSTAKGS